MAISATSSAGDTASLAAASGAATVTTAAEMEQRFLRLLTAQLKNQDPTNPLDNAQLTSQLAQMSTVSGIEKLNSALQSLLTQSSSNQVLQASSMIGRDVLAYGDKLTWDGEKPTMFGIETEAPAKTVTVTIADATGKIVRTYESQSLPQGVKAMAWDGKDSNGVRVASGEYKISVEARNDDKRMDAHPLVFSQVVSVAQYSNSISLDLANGKSTVLGDIKQVF